MSQFCTLWGAMSLWLALLIAGCSSAPPGRPSPTPTVSGGVLSGEIDSQLAEVREIREVLVAAGNLTADPGLQAEVGSPVGGRVEKLFAVPGDRVGVAQPLARLQSTEVTRARNQYHQAQLRLKLAENTLEQRRLQSKLGDISRRPLEEAQSELSQAISEREVAASGLALHRKKLIRARDLLEHGIGTRQELEEAEAEEQQARSRLEQAERQLRIARNHKDRESRLARSGALVTPLLLEAENEVALAREEVIHSRDALRDLGVEGEGEGLLLRAPVAGVIVESQARLGQATTPDQALFTILDSRRLWLWVYLYEAEQARVKIGMPATVAVSALPGRMFSARISDLPPVVELPARSLRARLEVDNADGSLRVGMAARVTIALRSPRRALMVPVVSLLTQGDRNVVYVQVDSGEYQPAEVQLGYRDPDQQWVEIVSGLKPGQRVLTRGAYLMGTGASQ